MINNISHIYDNKIHVMLAQTINTIIDMIMNAPSYYNSHNTHGLVDMQGL